MSVPATKREADKVRFDIDETENRVSRIGHLRFIVRIAFADRQLIQERRDTQVRRRSSALFFLRAG